MENFAIAVKAFIVNAEGKVLLIKRRPNDVHFPAVWEIPGGRLEQGEDPFLGVKRESMEEVGLDIDIKNPLKIHHSEYAWLSLDEAHERIVPAFKEEIGIYKQFFMGKV
jgi:mutator protein MutT